MKEWREIGSKTERERGKFSNGVTGIGECLGFHPDEPGRGIGAWYVRGAHSCSSQILGRRFGEGKKDTMRVDVRGIG